MEYISFNEQKIKKLQKLYDKALKDGQEVFTFENKEILTSYAKYLLEYLNLAKHNNKDK